MHLSVNLHFCGRKRSHQKNWTLNGIICFCFPNLAEVVIIHPPQKKKRRWNPKHGRNVNFGIFFEGCVWFCLFGFPCLFLVFWLVPFILLHVLVSFQHFLPLYGLFLSIRYAFCYIPCSFSQISVDFRCFFNFMLVSLEFCGVLQAWDFAVSSFNWLSAALISLYILQVLCRFNAFISFTAFRFHFASILLDSGCQNIRSAQENLAHSVHQARWFSQCMLHVAQSFPRLVTMVISLLDMSISLFNWFIRMSIALS